MGFFFPARQPFKEVIGDHFASIYLVAVRGYFRQVFENKNPNVYVRSSAFRRKFVVFY